jgi:hypothetical protein
MSASDEVDEPTAKPFMIIVAPLLPLQRNAIGQAIALHRPHLHVIEIAPDGLDAAIMHYRPDAVICTVVTDVVSAQVPIWIQIDRDRSHGSYSIYGELNSPITLSLADTLTILDKYLG